MPDAPRTYLDAFPPATLPDWEARVAAVLKGKGAASLTGRTYDGVPIAPLYRSAEDAPVALASRGWSVMSRVDDPGPETANAQVLEDLGNGADGLHLVCDGALGCYGFGISADEAVLATATRGVVFDAEIPVELDAIDGTGQYAEALGVVVVRSGARLGSTRINFGIDPFAAFARGVADVPDLKAPVRSAATLGEKGFAGPFFVADARLVHAAGGSEGQELGYALAAALDTLRALENGGVALPQARSWVSFRLAVDADEYLGVAKLRALRRLWASVEEQCGLTPAPAQLHAETAWRTMTRRDPDVNMLRATLAIFAAATGGADRISVLPHSQALGLPDAFARRVARNAQLVLREEANLDKVADPAAGAGGFETLTTALCEKGWAMFQEIEAAGGLAKALAGNAFRSAVADVASARAESVARRKDGIAGVSEFPHLGETVPSALRPRSAQNLDAPFAPKRLAAPFETLRDTSDATLARTGMRPKVFLATLGSLAASAPRASFAKNLFEAGGFETLLHDGPDAPEALAASFATSGARTACLCSSDAVYAEKAEAAARALAPSAQHLVVAGRPGESEAQLRAAGVTDFAYVGSNVLALLEKLTAV